MEDCCRGGQFGGGVGVLAVYYHNSLLYHNLNRLQSHVEWKVRSLAVELPLGRCNAFMQTRSDAAEENLLKHPRRGEPFQQMAADPGVRASCRVNFVEKFYIKPRAKTCRTRSRWIVTWLHCFESSSGARKQVSEKRSFLLFASVPRDSQQRAGR